jgi:hypothetical protein
VPARDTWTDGEQANAYAKGGQMLFDFSEAERNTTRRALEIYVTELTEEIVKTEKHEWREVRIWRSGFSKA